MTNSDYVHVLRFFKGAIRGDDLEIVLSLERGVITGQVRCIPGIQPIKYWPVVASCIKGVIKVDVAYVDTYMDDDWIKSGLSRLIQWT